MGENPANEKELPSIILDASYSRVKPTACVSRPVSGRIPAKRRSSPHQNEYYNAGIFREIQELVGPIR
jgi:hypothetical protein